MQCPSKALRKPEEMRRRSKTFLGLFSFLSFHAEVGPQGQRQLAAGSEGEGHAIEGWEINKEVVSKVCTGLDDILFVTVAKSVGTLSQSGGVATERPGGNLAADFSER